MFFNSVFFNLFSLLFFRYHVENFTTDRPSDADAVSNVKTVFRDIEESSER